MGRKFPVSFLISLILSLAIPAMAQENTRIWQETKSLSHNLKAVSATEEVEVFSAPNVIMVKVNKPCEIRIFTILGKLVSAQKLEPGIFEYHLDTHGIYIIKTENSSCKIAI